MISFANVRIKDRTFGLMKTLLEEGKIGQSEYIKIFEDRFANFLGVKHCVAVSNGTMADTIALAVLKHLYPTKRKVIVPALTFIAQVNSVYYNHLTPVFYDHGQDPGGLVDDETLCVFPVHLLGKPTPLSKWGVPVVEDACEALGSQIGGKYVGTFGDMGTFSFYPSHTMTMGEGGVIVTNNDEYAGLARRLRNHGKETHDDFKFDLIGFNGKMTSLQAVIGFPLIGELPSVFRERNKNYLRLGGIQEEGTYIVPHAFPAFFTDRDERMELLKASGIDCRRFFSSIPTQEKAYAFLGYKKGDFPLAEWHGDYGLYVPCHQGLTDDELNTIKEALWTSV